jgi:hypothetical protein
VSTLEILNHGWNLPLEARPRWRSRAVCEHFFVGRGKCQWSLLVRKYKPASLSIELLRDFFLPVAKALVYLRY